MAMDTDDVRCGFFATRESYGQALADAYGMLNRLSPGDKVVALTALHVVLNALADEIDREGVKRNAIAL